MPTEETRLYFEDKERCLCLIIVPTVAHTSITKIFIAEQNYCTEPKRPLYYNYFISVQKYLLWRYVFQSSTDVFF